jgi:adenine-specific DNA-methyltransferase
MPCARMHEDRDLSIFSQRGNGTRHDDNQIIQGDSLAALALLRETSTATVKCVFIDPPYNTGLAFGHYVDDSDHSTWLNFMRDRLELMRTLMSAEGSIWIAIDEHEGHYLKVLCDEVFGRGNSIATVIWQKRCIPKSTTGLFSSSHDYILVYGRDVGRTAMNRLPFPEESAFAALYLSPGSPSDVERWRKEGAMPPRSLWPAAEVGDNEEAKQESRDLFGENPFSTPKPERLLARVIEIASNPGDLVLDCFAGSGTTGAVAHKMDRRWILVECEDHATTHIWPRLKRVIEGTESIGITRRVAWRGAADFDFSVFDRATCRHRAVPDRTHLPAWTPLASYKAGG